MYEGPVQDLIDELSKLPGVGPKGAQRIAFHLLTADREDLSRLQGALQKIRDGVQFCVVCGTVSEQRLCRICSDPRRDRSLLCVVEEPKDVQAIERTREFKGVYHVLGGALDPIAGMGPDKLRIRELLARIGGQNLDTEDPNGNSNVVDIVEVIIATDPNMVGEATAAYLYRMLRGFPGLSVTRLASGLPMGGDLEFADELTLGRALTGRRSL
ncbi:recombination protein RecR [Hoyosella rhizosphaerae]|uniref:Recombination protein RecR n=1 Tax=Hoyosella rhizosphaerae TaxID=1755582 RepID=A0A916XJQ6_9ACTN|nr:recombination mediator RecR [Hoyosella rhizosphaerae]MBN4925402.1 recombination protein RecR [Hoyosella rhizosphaerae]GGC75469.1 recombination protein RecR [Hoyosella rhizosphaerae]